MPKKDNISALLAGEIPKIEKQMEASKWFGEHEEDLRKKYGGKFIAIRDKRIESSTDVDGLIGKLGVERSNWFIVYVSRKKTVACW
jgi:hypothetical protein